MSVNPLFIKRNLTGPHKIFIFACIVVVVVFSEFKTYHFYVFKFDLFWEKQIRRNCEQEFWRDQRLLYNRK